jgi:hypothetical protein
MFEFSDTASHQNIKGQLPNLLASLPLQYYPMVL